MGVFLVFAVVGIILLIWFILVCVTYEDRAYRYEDGEDSWTRVRIVKSKFWAWLYDIQLSEVWHIVLGFVSIILCLVALVLGFAGIGIRAQREIEYQKVYQEYVVLTERFEKDNGEYHLFYDDIIHYNNRVLSDRYWAKNKWVNWYHNGKIRYLPLIGGESNGRFEVEPVQFADCSFLLRCRS